MFITDPKEIQWIKRLVESGEYLISGTITPDEISACILATRRETSDIFFIPIGPWIALDETAFDYGVSAALLDDVSGEGRIIDQGTLIPYDDAEIMGDAALSDNSNADYWKGYNIV